MRSDTLAGFENIGNVRLVILVQRRWHAEDYGLDLTDAAEVCRRGERAAADLLLNVGACDVLDVASAGVAIVDLGRVVIQAKNPDAGTGELQGERQADVAKADDGEVHHARPRIIPPERTAMHKICLGLKRSHRALPYPSGAVERRTPIRQD